MFNRSAALFLTLVFLLVGMGVAQVGYVVELRALGRIPDSGWFWVCIVWSVVALLFGGVGSYQALRTGSFSQPPLLAFLIFSCVVMKVNGLDLGWSPLRLSVFVGVEDGSVGINFLAIALLIWKGKLRPVRSSTLSATQMAS